MNHNYTFDLSLIAIKFMMYHLQYLTDVLKSTLISNKFKFIGFNFYNGSSTRYIFLLIFCPIDKSRSFI